MGIFLCRLFFCVSVTLLMGFMGCSSGGQVQNAGSDGSLGGVERTMKFDAIPLMSKTLEPQQLAERLRGIKGVIYVDFVETGMMLKREELGGLRYPRRVYTVVFDPAVLSVEQIDAALVGTGFRAEWHR